MQKIIHSRCFWLSFLCTLLALLLLIGLVAVDAQGRKLSFNDTSPAAEIVYPGDGTAYISVNAFSLNAKINVTGAVKLWHFIADFFCIPHEKLESGTESPQTQ